MSITDVTTANVVVTRTGTGWTVDVTACNLLENLSVKDFVVLENGVLASNNDYTKTSDTLLTYVGAGVAASTSIEVRRETPPDVVKVVTFGDRFSSNDRNTEIAYVNRWRAEANLNGKGPGTLISGVTPLDDPFGVAWDGDTVRPATRNAIYDEVVLKAPLASPALTGVPTAPTPLVTDDSTTIATTAYVKTNLVSFAPLASPTFSGNPTAPTQAPGTNNTTLATTSFVATSFAPLASPVLTGTPTAPEAAYADDSAQIATTSWVRNAFEPVLIAEHTANQTFANSASVTVIYDSEILDTDNMYDPVTGLFTIPAGRGGYYLVNASLSLSNTVINDFTVLILAITVNAGADVARLYSLGSTGVISSGGTMLSGSAIVNLTASTTYNIRAAQVNLSTTTASTGTATVAKDRQLQIIRLPF